MSILDNGFIQPSLAIVNIDVVGEELRVTYDLTNPTGQPIYIINLISDKYDQLHPPPQNMVSTECAQVSYDGEAGAVLLHGITPSVASIDMDLYAPIRPLCSLLQKDASYRATIRTVLPLAEYSVYDGPIKTGPCVRPEMIKNVRVSVDYFLESDKDWVWGREDLPGAYEAAGKNERRLTTQRPLPQPIPMMVRSDAK